MNRRIWSLPLNIVIFNLCYLNPFRNKRIWIYGAREGHQYDDNSMHMFEYMNGHHPEIESIWMTNNRNILEKVNKKGYKCCLNNSIQGKKYQLKAGVAIYSHGLIDFGTFPLIGGADLVAVWHGTGLKKLYNGKFTGSKLMLKKALDHFFSWTRRTLTPITSEFSKKWVTEMFTLNENDIVITGQPRNDILKKINRNKILDAIEIPANKIVIIFMPTYRMPSLGPKAMENIIRDLYESKDLETSLEKNNAVFLTKLHPLVPHINIENRKNFRIIDYASVESNQELMGACDMLVTDYSSCFIDFALLEKPIIFYNPDDKDFLTKSEKMDAVFFEIRKLNNAVTPSELAEKINNPSLAVVEKTNEVFEDASIKGSCYCENVYNAIIKKIGI